MREREAKLIVPESFEVPDLHDAVHAASVGDVEVRSIDDVYYDTDDYRLARWGCTLRHRSSDGWTVKIPAPSDGVMLDREEVLVSGPAEHPPPEALDLVSPLTRWADVAEVARLTTTRRARTWRTPDGSTIGELTDDAVHGVSAVGAEVRFRELELELAPDADADAFDEVLRRLRSAGRSTKRPRPKLVRVLGAPATAEPDVTAPALPSDPTAADVIRTGLATSVARMMLNLPVARLGSDPEGVHQARVAARRLRSDLRTFAPLLEREWSDGLRSELRWLTDVLGPVRDGDVLAVAFGNVLASHPEIPTPSANTVLDALERQRAVDRSRLLDRLSDPRAAELLDRLVDAAADPRTTPKADRPARSVMPKLVRKRWRRLARAIDALGPEPETADLHGIRILAKRVRYASEAVAPAVGKPAKRFARHAATIQDALGDLHDAAVAGTWLEAASVGLPADGAFAAGRMAQQMLVDAEVHEQRWRRALRSLHKRSGWLS